MKTIAFSGYDGIPIDSMQGLDISSSQNTYDQVDNSRFTGGGNNSFYAESNEDVNTSRNNASQIAAWYDTDL